MKYKMTKCIICNYEISAGGAAFVAHMRKHVRLGEAIESSDGTKLIFRSIKDGYIEPEPYAKIGHAAIGAQPDGVWDISDFIKELGKIKIDSEQYFVTSGEAIKKIEQLIKDCSNLSIKAKSLRNLLYKAKGAARYMETHRENSRIIVKCKSPRKKQDDESTDETDCQEA